MTTMMRMIVKKKKKIIVVGDVPLDQRYESVDITEGVRTLYDLLIASIDWGSGYLTYEDAEPVVALAKACGFEGWEEAQQYVDKQKHSKEQAIFLRKNRPLSHEHLYQIYLEGTTYTELECQFPECQVVAGSERDIADREANLRWRGVLPHEHVFSTVGKCMWPNCNEPEYKQNETGTWILTQK
jgi:hypothetical protein